MMWWHKLFHNTDYFVRRINGIHSGIEQGRTWHYLVCECGATWRRVLINPLYSEFRWQRVK